MEILPKLQGGAILLNDNAESRELLEGCYQKDKVVLNPIIDWEDEDVWEFIKTNNIPYCSLYDQGYTRLGCIGCPMSTAAAAELEKYPKYRAAYIRAFERMLKERNLEKMRTVWNTGEDVMNWWLGYKIEKPLPGQIELEV